MCNVNYWLYKNLDAMGLLVTGAHLCTVNCWLQEFRCYELLGRGAHLCTMNCLLVIGAHVQCECWLQHGFSIAMNACWD